MKVGLAADHAGFALKGELFELVRSWGHEVEDFGAYTFEEGDDYPDLVIPLAQSVGRGDCERGVAVCGSGVGVSVAANRVKGVRAALITDIYSAHQGVEHDAMNIICIGSRVSGAALAADLVRAFLGARFSGLERYVRRLEKVAALERG